MNFCQCSPIVPAMFLCVVLSWWGGVCHDKIYFCPCMLELTWQLETGSQARATGSGMPRRPSPASAPSGTLRLDQKSFQFLNNAWVSAPLHIVAGLHIHISWGDAWFEMWHGTLLRRSLNVFSWSAPLLLICDLQCLLLAHSLHTNST